MKKVDVQKRVYYDSVFLMRINKEVEKLEGVKSAVVSMGTEMNLDILKRLGFTLDEAGPNDLILAVDAESAGSVEAAIQTARELIRKEKRSSENQGEYQPASLESAIGDMPDANMVLISVPGQYAAAEAEKALDKGLNVMLFSDNVSIDDEIRLKKRARERGLLMMGPDCGTAIINGKPLAFANVVNRGPIGIVAASGTGLQEVSCIISERGSGISQAIGTGGRDLKDPRVGGSMMLTGIEALCDDEETKVIVVISKPPAESIVAGIVGALSETRKPCVVHFIGMPAQDESSTPENIHYAHNLEEAAGMALALVRGEDYEGTGFTLPKSTVKEIVQRETREMSTRQLYVRGLYTGGTLADETVLVLNDALGGVHSFDAKDPALRLRDPHISEQHTVVDLGEDVFTVGRPHPMIEPSTREERIRAEAEDPALAVLLLDIVLGYGSHEDPAGAILDSIRTARTKAADRGGYLPVIVSVTGTRSDYQDLKATEAKLNEAGCVVMPSNYQAARMALEIMKARR